MCVYACVCSRSHARCFVTSSTVVHQAPPSMEFPRQEYWSGLPFPTPGDLPDPGIKPTSPALAGRFFNTVTTRCVTASCLKKNVHNLIWKYIIPKKHQNNYNNNINDHPSQITLTNEITIKKFKMLQELPKCDRETQSEQMLLEKWWR